MTATEHRYAQIENEALATSERGPVRSFQITFWENNFSQKPTISHNYHFWDLRIYMNYPPEIYSCATHIRLYTYRAKISYLPMPCSEHRYTDKEAQ